MRNLSTAAVAKVRQQASVGVMGDAFADETFCRALVKAIGERREIATAQGKASIQTDCSVRPARGRRRRFSPVARPQGSSSNTVVVMGDRLILKGYRRLRTGTSPELEMGLYLTDVVHYANCAPLAGVLEHRDKDGEPRLLALLQAYVANQGDGWTYSLEYLRRHLEEHRMAPISQTLPTFHEAYLALVRVLAVRTAELHRALATPTKDLAFAPPSRCRAPISRATESARPPRRSQGLRSSRRT